MLYPWAEARSAPAFVAVLNCNALDLIERDLIARSIVQLPYSFVDPGRFEVGVEIGFEVEMPRHLVALAALFISRTSRRFRFVVESRGSAMLRLFLIVGLKL